MRASLEAFRAVRGGDSARTLLAENDLAVLLSQAGQHDEAEGLYRHALDGLRRAGPAHESQVFTILHNLAGPLEDRGQLHESEPMYREVFTRWTAEHGPQAGKTLSAGNSLAVSLYSPL